MLMTVSVFLQLKCIQKSLAQHQWQLVKNTFLLVYRYSIFSNIDVFLLGPVTLLKSSVPSKTP